MRRKSQVNFNWNNAGHNISFNDQEFVTSTQYQCRTRPQYGGRYKNNDSWSISKRRSSSSSWNSYSAQTSSPLDNGSSSNNGAPIHRSNRYNFNTNSPANNSTTSFHDHHPIHCSNRYDAHTSTPLNNGTSFNGSFHVHNSYNESRPTKEKLSTPVIQKKKKRRSRKKKITNVGPCDKFANFTKSTQRKEISSQQSKVAPNNLKCSNRPNLSSGSKIYKHIENVESPNGTNYSGRPKFRKSSENRKMMDPASPRKLPKFQNKSFSHKVNNVNKAPDPNVQGAIKKEIIQQYKKENGLLNEKMVALPAVEFSPDEGAAFTIEAEAADPTGNEGSPANIPCTKYVCKDNLVFPKAKSPPKKSTQLKAKHGFDSINFTVPTCKKMVLSPKLDISISDGESEVTAAGSEVPKNKIIVEKSQLQSLKAFEAACPDKPTYSSQDYTQCSTGIPCGQKNTRTTQSQDLEHKKIKAIEELTKEFFSEDHIELDLPMKNPTTSPTVISNKTTVINKESKEILVEQPSNSKTSTGKQCNKPSLLAKAIPNSRPSITALQLPNSFEELNKTNITVYDLNGGFDLGGPHQSTFFASNQPFPIKNPKSLFSPALLDNISVFSNPDYSQRNSKSLPNISLLEDEDCIDIAEVIPSSQTDKTSLTKAVLHLTKDSSPSDSEINSSGNENTPEKDAGKNSDIDSSLNDDSILDYNDDLTNTSVKTVKLPMASTQYSQVPPTLPVPQLSPLSQASQHTAKVDDVPQTSDNEPKCTFDENHEYQCTSNNPQSTDMKQGPQVVYNKSYPHSLQNHESVSNASKDSSLTSIKIENTAVDDNIGSSNKIVSVSPSSAQSSTTSATLTAKNDLGNFKKPALGTKMKSSVPENIANDFGYFSKPASGTNSNASVPKNVANDLGNFSKPASDTNMKTSLPKDVATLESSQSTSENIRKYEQIYKNNINTIFCTLKEVFTNLKTKYMDKNVNVKFNIKIEELTNDNVESYTTYTFPLLKSVKSSGNVSIKMSAISTDSKSSKSVKKRKDTANLTNEEFQSPKKRIKKARVGIRKQNLPKTEKCSESVKTRNYSADLSKGKRKDQSSKKKVKNTKAIILKQLSTKKMEMEEINKMANSTCIQKPNWWNSFLDDLPDHIWNETGQKNEIQNHLASDANKDAKVQKLKTNIVGGIEKKSSLKADCNSPGNVLELSEKSSVDTDEMNDSELSDVSVECLSPNEQLSPIPVKENLRVKAKRPLLIEDEDSCIEECMPIRNRKKSRPKPVKANMKVRTKKPFLIEDEDSHIEECLPINNREKSSKKLGKENRPTRLRAKKPLLIEDEDENSHVGLEECMPISNRKNLRPKPVKANRPLRGNAKPLSFEDSDEDCVYIPDINKEMSCLIDSRIPYVRIEKNAEIDAKVLELNAKLHARALETQQEDNDLMEQQQSVLNTSRQRGKGRNRKNRFKDSSYFLY